MFDLPRADVRLLLLLLPLLLLAFRGAVPVVEDLQGEDAVAGGGDDVGESHQRISGFLWNPNTSLYPSRNRLYFYVRMR